MGMMAKMRGLAPAFILTVGVLFVLFMVISDSNVMQAITGGRTNNIGSVNGEDITYQEFQRALENQLQSQKQQTGKDVPEDQMDQFRDHVWESLVTEKLITQEVKRLGITVSDQEIKDVILGDNPPAFLKQNFIDSTGKFNRAAYEDAIFNPQNEKVLLQAEEVVRQSRYREKLQSMLEAGITVSEPEVKQKFIQQNTNMKANYVLFANTLFPDSTLKITDEDLKKYYEENADKFKITAQRKIDFVLFRNEPSKEDSSLVIKNLENVKKMIESDTANFKYFADIYSEEPYKIDTLAVTAFSKEAYQQLKNAKIGETLGPVPSSQGYELIHLLNIIPTNEEYVRASHILIPHQGDDEKNKLLADSIYTAIKNGASFKEMAMKYSKDPGSAKNGGDLGWFGKGTMVKEFENAVFNGKVGEVQKPISTQFGYHIILVTDETNKKYIVEQIINKVQESATTKDLVYNSAKDFAYLADKNGFEKEAELGGYKIQQSTAFMKNTTTIPGVGANKRMINFAFENSLNDVSDAMKEPNGFVVAKISEIIPEGIQKFEDVKPRVRELLIKEKQYEKGLQLANEVMKKAGNDLNKVPQIDPRLSVVNTGNFNTTSVIPNIGRDNAFIEHALQLKKGEVSEPFKSLRGYYVMELTEKTPFDSTLFKAQSSTIRNSLIQEKKNASLNEWLTLIKDKADIVDNRYMFYTY